MEENLYIWEVLKHEHYKGNTKQVGEVIVAGSLEQVLKYLEKARVDPSVDIISINKTAIVNAIL